MPFVVVAGLLGFVADLVPPGARAARPDDIGDYWREVPDDPPAVGRSLLDFGSVDAIAFSATVVDLAQRGYLRISEERTDRLIGKDKVTYRFDNRAAPRRRRARAVGAHGAAAAVPRRRDLDPGRPHHLGPGQPERGPVVLAGLPGRR